MRLFVAIVPPPEALEHLAAALESVQAVQGEALAWTTTEQWHLTLAFLGEVDDVRRERVEQRLARAASRSPPLDLRISAAGAFGSPKRARVLWAGVDGEATALSRLADSVQAAARRSGIPIEARRYRPHLALARCRAPVDVTPALEQLSTYAGPVWVADTIRLVRSHLGAAAHRRARHETVAAWPLQGRRSGGG